MSVPGIASLTLIWAFASLSVPLGLKGWIAFLVGISLYLGVYGLAAFLAFVAAALLTRRFGSIAKGRLYFVGIAAGLVYLPAVYGVFPLPSEKYYIAAWVAVALCASLLLLLRWGTRDG